MKTKFLKLWRTFKEGVRSFFRNGWLSFATVSILTLSLYVVSATALLGITAATIVQNIEENVDISVYFNPDVGEEDVNNIRQELENFPDVSSVEYVSSDQALEDFIRNTGDDPVISEALEEIGENPLLESLVVKGTDPNRYESIATFIENASFNDKINNINYGKNKSTIDNLNRIIGLARKTGIVLGSIFIVIAILITFNTIRLTMYSRKREFEIMRLVGASNMYVQMPSIFEGIFYGVTAAIVSVGLIFATAQFVSPLTVGVIPYDNLISFYLQYFWPIFGILILFGVVLGIISSFIAIRRYLKV